MKDWTIPPDREFMRKWLGSPDQIAGFRRYRFSEGKAAGVEAVDVRNGRLNYTVLPGRGMDIAWAEYRGTPLCYMSRTGIVSPAYYSADENGWLRNFAAGLLTTCGLSNVGDPCAEDHQALGSIRHGLHGRIANAGAENVSLREGWSDGAYSLAVSGRVREAMVHGEHLVMERVIRTALGGGTISIRDTVENAGAAPTPMTLMYHFNFGYPLLSPESGLLCPSRRVAAYDDASERDIGEWRNIREPVVDQGERCYFHDLTPGPDGRAAVALVNDALELGVALEFRVDELPAFTLWKNFRAGEYVLGLEPGNCAPVGRAKLRERGELPILAAGERKSFGVDVTVLDGPAEIEAFRSTRME